MPTHRHPVWRALPTPAPSPYAAETVAGLGLRELIVNESSWVHRRVETFEFIDDRTVRRQMSVDLTVPYENRLVRALFDLEGPFIPLTMLRKSPLGHLDVWTEESRALPVLTSEQNGRLAGMCLFGTARQVLRRQGPDPQDLPPAVTEALRRVAALDRESAEHLLRCMLRSGGITDRNASALADPPKTWTRDAELALLATALDRHAKVLEFVFASSTLRTLLRELASRFLLTVQVRPEDIGRRQVLKFAYDEPVALAGSHKRLRLHVKRGLSSFSYAPAQFNFTGLAVGRAASHHVEVVAPAQLEVVSMTFDGAAASPSYRRTVRTSGVGQRTHAHLSGAPRSATGTVTVEFRAERAGLLRAAPLLAGLVLGALLLLTAHAGAVEGDAAAALLLVAPGVIAALIVRPGEHRMTTSVLVGVRALVMGSALCAFIAATYVAVGFEDETLRHHLVPLSWIAAGILEALVLSYLLPPPLRQVVRRAKKPRDTLAKR